MFHSYWLLWKYTGCKWVENWKYWATFNPFKKQYIKFNRWALLPTFFELYIKNSLYCSVTDLRQYGTIYSDFNLPRNLNTHCVSKEHLLWSDPNNSFSFISTDYTRTGSFIYAWLMRLEQFYLEMGLFKMGKPQEGSLRLYLL